MSVWDCLLLQGVDKKKVENCIYHMLQSSCRAHGLIEGDLYIGALFSIHDQVSMTLLWNLGILYKNYFKKFLIDLDSLSHLNKTLIIFTIPIVCFEMSVESGSVRSFMEIFRLSFKLTSTSISIIKQNPLMQALTKGISMVSRKVAKMKTHSYFGNL